MERWHEECGDGPEIMLYRVYGLGPDGVPPDPLLYVGISQHWERRFVQHHKTQPWWADVRRVEIVDVCCRRHALAEERRAIEDERPIYNVVHAR